jgi:hypothetical protein
VTPFGRIVVIVDLGPQFLLFDDGLLLVLTRLALLLRRLVFELAVVHDLADRRFGVRGNFDKVEIGIRGDAKGVFDTHNAYLLPSRTDQSDFRYADAFVDAGLSADGASLIGLSRLPPSPAPFGVSGWDATPSAKKPCISRARCRPITAKAACQTQNRRTNLPVTGPLSLESMSLANGGSGTPLAVSGFAGDGRAGESTSHDAEFGQLTVRPATADGATPANPDFAGPPTRASHAVRNIGIP